MVENVYHSINFSRCHHFICDLLKKRCEQRYLIFMQDKHNPDNFEIHKLNTNSVLKFIRNPETKYFALNNSMFLSNENLLGLNDVTLLFDLLKCFNDIRRKVDVVIQNNEIKAACHFPEAFLSSEIIIKLDKLSKKHRFTIQLMSDNMLAINQCIRITPSLFVYFINDDEINEMLFILASRYLETFQIAPICCKMQSLSYTMAYWNIFSTYYLQKHHGVFLNIVKLLYPYIKSLENDIMIRQYFEIMPVKLIELGNPYALLKLLEQLNSHNISVKILRSGQILRLDDFYDIHHKMFLNLKSVNTFMKALTILRSLNKKLAFYKAGDLSIIESESFIEPVDFCRSIVLDVPNENGIELQSYYPNEVHYFPKCQYCKWDLSESHMAIINYMPFAMMWDSFRECWNNDELRKEIHLVVKYMKQCVFSWHHLFAYFRKPLIITNLNRYRYDSTNLEYILLNETMHFRTLELFANAEKYNEFFYQNTGHLPEETAYLEFILIFKKLLYDEGLLLWFNDDTVTFFSSYAYDKYDGYKRSLICKEVMPQAILVLQSLLSDNHSFEIMEDGAIAINKKFKFYPFILMAIKDKKSFINAIIKFNGTIFPPWREYLLHYILLYYYDFLGQP